MNNNNPLHKTTHASLPSLVQLEKMQKLSIRGYTDEEAEELCRPKQVDMEEAVERIMKFQEKELRRLAKLSPKPKKLVRPKEANVDEVTEIQISAVDLAEDLKWMATVKSGE